MEETPIYLLAFAATWLVSHCIKYVIAVVKSGDVRQFAQFFRSGGIPSAHSASMMALTTTIGLVGGFGTPIFALALAVTAVIMYDAVTVRRSSGEQGAALTQVITKGGFKVKQPFVAKGHTLTELVIGALLGIVVGVVVFLATNS